MSEEVIRMRADNEEVNEMANNIYEIFDNQISKMQEQLRGEQPETAAPVRIQILKTMETFRAQGAGNKNYRPCICPAKGNAGKHGQGTVFGG